MTKPKMTKKELLNYYHAQIMAKMLIQEQLDEEISKYMKMIEALR